MSQSLTHIALIVRDYDEAIAWFTDKLGFTLVADEYQPEQDKRWVLVAPPGAGDNAATLLALLGSLASHGAAVLKIGPARRGSECGTSQPTSAS